MSEGCFVCGQGLGAGAGIEEVLVDGFGAEPIGEPVRSGAVWDFEEMEEDGDDIE